MRFQSQGRVFALPINVRQGGKWLEASKALAYNTAVLLSTMKNVMEILKCDTTS
jgi:hypothetical protein